MSVLKEFTRSVQKTAITFHKNGEAESSHGIGKSGLLTVAKLRL
jgi:hypothetical protein